MIHFFNTKIAKEVGILSAVLLENINYWCEKNKANCKHQYDDNSWTYNSSKAFATLFDYVSAKQIETALKKLREQGFIITGNYNSQQYDRTLWYAVTEKGKCILQNGKMEITKSENGDYHLVEPIPNNKQIINNNNKPIYFENERLNDVYLEFIQMRKEIKHPVTKTVIEKNKKLLQKYSVEEAIRMLEQSINNSYQGIFEVRANFGGNKKSDYMKTTTTQDSFYMSTDLEQDELGGVDIGY